MSLNRVKEYFKEFNLEDRIKEFDEGASATVELASKALNCEEGRIAKSMSFLLKDGPIIIVVKGDNKIDNHKYKEEFLEKAKMISYEEVEHLIGHKPGGVCPFCVNDNVRVFLDVSLKEYDYVYPAAGSSNSAIKLTIEELEKYSNYVKWVNVCKN